MTYALAGLSLLVAVLGAGLYKSVQRSGALSEQLHTAQTELDDAKTQAEALNRAAKRHAQELAAARKVAAQASRSVATVADDGCLDRMLPASIGDVLRMHPENDKAAAPASGRAKADASVHRPNIP